MKKQITLLAAMAVLLQACATSAPAPVSTVAAPAAEVVKATDAPKATEPPAPTEAPKPTDVPKPTDAPKATEAPKPTEAPKAAEGAMMPASFTEAPMLADLAKAGKIKALKDRLPEKPQIVTPLGAVGKYGGILRQGIVGASATWGGMLYTVQWENLVQWKPDFSGVEPSIAESIESSPDGKVYTIKLRKGMKWSDGEPFTAEDLDFYVNDVLGDKELSPNGIGADWMPAAAAKDFKAEQVDETTFKLTFGAPYGTFMLQLATWSGRQWAQYPKHYLKQYHKKYNEKIDDLVKKDGKVKDWTALFFKYAPDNWGNPDRFMDVVEYPSLGPWVVKQPLGSGTKVIFERNPYYWKTDDKGNQLPYIDSIETTSYQDGESRTFAMLNGDLDYVKDPGEANREIYFDAVKQGKSLQIKKIDEDSGNTVSIHFNQTTKDAAKAKLFSNKDFRIGMSHSINREEVIEVVFKGQGKPAQVGPLESSALYNEKLATQYIKYDVVEANKILDGILPDKDADGMRTLDGKRLSIVWTVLDSTYTGGDAVSWARVAELCVGYFEKVGVEVKIDTISDKVLGERRDKNDIEMFIFHGNEGGAGLTAMLDSRWHVPGQFWGKFGLGWYLASTKDPKFKDVAVAIPPNVQKIRDDYDAVTQLVKQEDQINGMKKILDSSAENFWVIGVSRMGPAYQPISKRLQNLPETWSGGWLEGSQKITRPEQWFITE
jgi:peptide/nickel transport system substrate-binding protein